MTNVDLNALRKAVTDNQNRNDPTPSNPALQVVVSRDGSIKMGDTVQPGEVTTQVPQETFAM